MSQSESSISIINMGISDIYANYLAAKMYELQRSNLFCDAIILLDNLQLKVHSVVLAAASPKLKMMMECLKAASKPLMLEMAGCTSEVAEIMLEYLYTGNVVGWSEREKEWSDLIKLFTLLEIPLPYVNTEQENGMTSISASTQPDGCNILENKQKISESFRNTASLKLISFPLNISNAHFRGKTEKSNGSLESTTTPVVLNTSLVTKARSAAVTRPGELQRVGAKEFIIEKRNLPKPSFNFFKTEGNTVIKNNNNNNFTFLERNDRANNREEIVGDILTSFVPPLASSSTTTREVIIVSPQNLNFSSSALHHRNNNHHNADLVTTFHDIDGNVVEFPEVTSDISVDVTTGCQVFDVSAYHDVEESNLDVDLKRKNFVKKEFSCEVPPVLSSSSGKRTRSMKSVETSDVESLEDSKKICSYQCGECKRVFQSNAALLTHMRCHKKKIPQVCSECHQIFGYPVFLSRHMLDKHGMFACPKCGNDCVCPPERAKQLRDQVMNSEKLICQECGKACSSKETMRKHQLIHTTTPSEHVCDICGKSFRIKCQLSSHLSQHNQQLHKCSTCSATFPSQWKLDVHAQTHKDVRPIECTICHARFFSRQTLRIHFYRHEGTEFKCPHCSKVLSTPFNLRNHMKIHLRETHKNFKCNLCNKFYYDYKDLTRHKKSHLDLRPHACLKCNRAFKSKAHLNYHLNSHNNEGPVECEACGATFKKKYSYKQHLLKSKCRGAEGARGKKRERAKLRKMQEAQLTSSTFDEQCEEILIEVNASDIEEHYVHDGLI